MRQLDLVLAKSIYLTLILFYEHLAYLFNLILYLTASSSFFYFIYKNFNLNKNLKKIINF